MMRWKLEPL
jgi:hypothetical protein